MFLRRPCAGPSRRRPGAGAAIPLWQFFVVRPAIERVYNKPVTLGWGVWLMPLGFALVVIAAWWQTFASTRRGRAAADRFAERFARRRSSP